MSDFEDDMDVDAPVVHDTVMFSSDNATKGKRSAANLPVEAEDSLPWYVYTACIFFEAD
jgi:replication factor C subunit 3/5